jgi:hypothetical protein
MGIRVKNKEKRRRRRKEEMVMNGLSIEIKTNGKRLKGREGKGRKPKKGG